MKKNLFVIALILLSNAAQAMPASFGLAKLRFNVQPMLCDTQGHNCADDPNWQQFGTQVSYYKGECINWKNGKTNLYLALFPPRSKAFGTYLSESHYVNLATTESYLVKKMTDNRNYESVMADFINNPINLRPIFTGEAYFTFYDRGWGTALIRGDKDMISIRSKMFGQVYEYCFFKTISKIVWSLIFWIP